MRPTMTRVTLHICFALGALFGSAPAEGASYVVSSLNDSGVGSLRQAITQANANPGPDSITFSVSGTILNTTAMTGISDDETTIDATGQDIILQASGIAFPSPIQLSSNNNVIRGFTITGYISDDGMEITGNGNLVSNMVINGNAQGLRIGGNDNQVQGCFIGIDSDGMTVVANSHAGLILQLGATGNIIGGTSVAERNIISGNGGNGIELDGAPSNSIIGNYIGTSSSGTVPLGNGADGILLDHFVNDSSGNVIGGTAAGALNVIAANVGNGVHISGAGSNTNLVQGNNIGIDATGTSSLSNGVDGVLIDGGASNNSVGGEATGAGNLIVTNISGVGVTGAGSIGNSILANSMLFNSALGIDLYSGSTGVTLNDAGDVDAGPNDFQNFPVLTSAATGGAFSNAAGTYNSAAGSVYHLEFFANAFCDASGYGQGQTFIGSTDVTTDNNGNAAFDLQLAGAAGAAVTATATSADGSTSEFSACLAPVLSGAIQFAAATYSVNEKLGSVDLTVTRTGGSAGAVSVNVVSSDATASSPADYASVNQLVTFADGDTTSQIVTVTVVDNPTVGADKTVNFTLQANAGAVLGAPSTAVLTIIDKCGDGVLDTGEQCDDGNRVDGDGCDSNCTLPGCGNGIVESGEQCDDANSDDSDACRNDCTLAACGDGVVETGVEACDGKNLGTCAAAQICSSTCSCVAAARLPPVVPASPGTPANNAQKKSGCGCHSSNDSAALGGLIVLFILGRQRRVSARV